MIVCIIRSSNDHIKKLSFMKLGKVPYFFDGSNTLNNCNKKKQQCGPFYRRLGIIEKNNNIDTINQVKQDQSKFIIATPLPALMDSHGEPWVS